MQTTWKVTEADRDNAGKIKIDSTAPAEPRSLADLLPKPEAIRKDAKRQPWTRLDAATLAVVGLCAAFVLIYAWATPRTPPAPPQARPTALPTFQPTAAPTALPAPPVASLVGYFDYQDTGTATAIEARQIVRVVGQAGAWRLVQIGDTHVWIAADAVPAGVPADSPLPNLAPRPTPRPVVQPASAPGAAPGACAADTAPYRVERQVLIGTLPVGAAMGFSCASAAAAEANADAHEAEVRSSYQATTTTSEAR